MNYEQIFAIIKKHMEEVLDDLDVSTVESQKKMKDYGADSLENVEIVSRTIKEVGIKVPRTEIMSAKNIDDFINILLAHYK